MSATRGLICAMAIGMLISGVAYPALGETNATTQHQHKHKGFGSQFIAKLDQLNLTPTRASRLRQS